MTGFSFGSTGTSQPTQSTPSFGFGAQNATTPSTGFNFGGTPLNQPAASSSFGFGGNPSTSFGFGSNTTTASGGLFVNKPLFSSSTGFSQTSGGSLFTAPKTTSSFGFGTNTPSTGFGFGSNPTSAGFGFGTNTTSTGFGFGGNTFKPFSSTIQPQLPFQNQPFGQQQQSIDPNVALYMAVCAPTFFNDERDEVLKKWNQLQAVWGAGKGYYAQNMPPVDFTPDNPFCRFKAVGYIKLPSYTPEDGFVELIIGKKEPEVRTHQQQIVDTLIKVFEGCQVCVDYVVPFGEEKTRMCIYVQQRNPNGETKKAQAWMVYNHLNSQNMKQTAQNLCIENATPLVSLSESQLKEYLDSPPQGIDPMIWEQGKRANPDPKKYLPVPMVGFQELKARFKAQEEESRLLQGQLDGIAEEITGLQGKQAKLLSGLQECKRRQMLMSHRVLKLVVKQEVNRKRGVPIEEGEEHLRMLLEVLHTQLASPTQYMGRLNELLSQISLNPSFSLSSMGANKNSDTPRFILESEAEKDLHQFLSWEQDAIKEMMQIVKDDLQTANALIEKNK